MGQGCSGNLSDVLSDPANNNSDSLSAAQLHNGHSRADTLWRHVHSKRIYELLEIFSPEDIQRLLWLYRSKCYAERSKLLIGSQPSNNFKAASQLMIHPSWRRVTLSDGVLFSLFPSLHVNYISGVLESLSHHRSSTNGSHMIRSGEERGHEVDWPAVMNHLRVVDKKHLIRAFHCASYLYNPIDAVDTSIRDHHADMPHHPSVSVNSSFKVSNSVLNLNTSSTSNPVTNSKNAADVKVFTPTELLLQDFLFALSLCKEGAYLEQLTFLFVLFAEPNVDNNGNSNSNSSNRRSLSNANSLTSNLAGSRPTDPSNTVGVNTATVTSEPRSPDHISVEMTPMQDKNNTTVSSSTSNGGTTLAASSATNTTTINTTNNNTTIINPTASPAPLISAKSRISLTGSSKTTAAGDRTQLQKLELTELGAMRLWVFMQLQLLRVVNPVLSVVCSGSSNNWKYSQIASVDGSIMDWNDCCGVDPSVYTTLLYYAEKLATMQALHTTNNANTSTALSYAEFIQLAYTAHSTHTLPKYSHLSTSNTNTERSSIFDTLHLSNVLSAFNVKSVLQELACDVLPSDAQIYHLSKHQLTSTTSRRHGDLNICLSLLNAQQALPQDVRSVHEVFVLDARWFLEWCRRNKLTPVFYHPTTDPTNPITTTINTSIVYNSSNITANLPAPSPKASSPKKKARGQRYKPPYKDTSGDIKHLLVGLVPMVDLNSDVNGDTNGSSASNKHVAMPALHNAVLLYKDALGVYRFKPSNQLVPYTPTTSTLSNTTATTNTNNNSNTDNINNTSGEVDTYVIVPYTVGKAMYEYFDPQSQYIAASVYKRVVRVASSARPVPTGEVTSTINSNDDAEIASNRDALQAIAPTATQLIKNFQSVNTVYTTSHPPLVPLYVCTNYGTPSVAPIDTLMLTLLPPVSEYAPSVCSVRSTYGMYNSCNYSSSADASVEMTTIEDFIVHTTTALHASGTCITGLATADVQKGCRVWGLYADPTQTTNTFTLHTPPSIQHTTTTVWRLLTSEASDYAIPLSTLFTDTTSSKMANKTRTQAAHHQCLGLMVEYTTTPYVLFNRISTTTVNTATPIVDANSRTGTYNDSVYSVWPTDRVLHAHGHTRSLPQSTNSACNKECPFSIAEHVDVLNNNNQWCVGIVTNIARDHVPTKEDANNVNVSITVRPLVDSDGSAVATKVPKLSGPAVRNSAGNNSVTVESDNQLQPTDTTIMAADQNGTSNSVINANDNQRMDTIKKTVPNDQSDSEEGEEEGSEEGSVESAIVNNRTKTTATAAATNVISNNDKAKNDSGEGISEDDNSAEGSGSEESRSGEESADDNSRIRDKRRTINNNTTNSNNTTKNGATSAPTYDDTAKAGVTWPSGTNPTNSSNIVVVAYNSLRILDLGTMTNPTITISADNNTPDEKAYLPAMLSSLHTVFRQHLAQQATSIAASVDSPVYTRNACGVTVSHQPSPAPLSAMNSTNNINASLATPTKAIQNNNIAASPKQEADITLTGHKNSFFNSPSKSSVFPHTPEVNSVNEEQAQPDTTTVVVNGDTAARSGKNGQLTTYEWTKLVQYMYNVSTCPFSLRTLYIMLLSERIVLLPYKHPHKCITSITSGLYDATRYLYIAPSVAPEFVGMMHSADDNQSTTSYSTYNSSNAPHYRHKHQRDPFSKFFKNCSKHLQHSFAPRESEVIGQTDLMNHLNGTTSRPTTTSQTANTTSNSQTRVDSTNTNGVEEDARGMREERTRTTNAKSSSSSTINAQTNSNSAFPNQKTTNPNTNTLHEGSITSRRPSAATIAKPPAPVAVAPNVGNIGVRIVGVAGLNNLGNTCFMSASLQCLFRTTTLINYFLTMQYKLDINTRSNLGSKGKLTEEFAKFVHTIFTLQPASLTAIQHYAVSTVNTTSIPRSLQYTSYSPTPLLRAFQAHKPQFSGADQQDSQEFLCELLDTFHEDLKLPRSSGGNVNSNVVPSKDGAGSNAGNERSANNSDGAGNVNINPAATTVGVPPATILGGEPTAATAGVPTVPVVAPIVSTVTPVDTTITPDTTATSATINPTTVNPAVTHRERSHSTASLDRRTSRSSIHTILPLTEDERTLSVQEQGNHTWAHYMQNNASIVTNLFQGQMCSKVVCNLCHTSSANFEPFTTLSMPIPRTNAVALAHSELTTVFITVYRKMPRLQRILHLPEYVFDQGRLKEGQLIELYQSTRNPIKLALSFPRNTSIEQVLLKAVNVYNQYELQCMQESFHNNINKDGGNGSDGINESILGGIAQEPNGTTGESTAHSPVVRSASKTHIVRQQSTLSQRSLPNNGTLHPSAEVKNNPGGAEVNTPAPQTPNSDRDNGSTATSINNNTPNKDNADKGTSSIYAIQPLVFANTVVIDVNDKQKGRYGKMLDRRDILQTLLDESTNECHLVLQERVKDISFVAGLSASRLNADYIRHQRPQDLALRNNNNPNNTNNPPLQDYFPSLLGYFDACEYDTTHVLYNDSHVIEGPLVCDFDYTYDPATYPKHSSNTSLTAMIAAYAEQSNNNTNNNTTTTTTHSSTSTKSKKMQPPLLAHVSTTNTSHLYNNTKIWPKSLEFFQIGDRVDCLDYKGTWYSGSVIDILDLTEKDIKQFQLMGYSRDFLLQPNSYGATPTTNNVSSKVLCVPGLHMRVHFDGFKGNWDEWYDQKDFQCGFIAPVYSNASRKLKMHEIPVIQRRLVYTSSIIGGDGDNGVYNSDQPPTPPGYNNTNNSNTNTNTSVSLHIDILDNPSFVQGESYRSCMHLYNHIHEQMLRYVDNELLLHTLQLPVGHPDQPFTIRLLSFDNLLAAPIDCYCPTSTVAVGGEGGEGGGGIESIDANGNTATNSTGGEVPNGTLKVVTSNVSPGLEFSIADRFNGHKSWEGSGLPMDVCRPLGNIYHSKLAIAVDWTVFIDNTHSSSMGHNGSGISDNGNGPATPVSSGIAAGLLHDSMVFRHEPSYSQYLTQLKANQQILQQNEVRRKEQLAREEQMKDRSGKTGDSSYGTAGAGTGSHTKPIDKLVEAYNNDHRNGLTIEEVISKFVHSEDIEEYYCNTCKKQTPGKLHSSIHTLPDVLILHLQRLVMNGTGGGKIRTLVKFPLSQLNMKPFTTEQKELVTNLTDKGANYVSEGGAKNNEDAENKDVYELYGVVNHIGGMNGGHYTALSKVEEIVLHDVMKHRYCNTNANSSRDSNSNTTDNNASGSSSGGGVKHDGVCYDDVNTFVDTSHSGTKLSLHEFITTTTAAVPTAASINSSADINTNATGSKANATPRWLKFDDEFVNVVPNANLHTNVVTESAVLLFYQRKNMSNKNLIRYI